MVMTYVALFAYRARPISTQNVPSSGAFILAPNHFSNMDHFFAGVHVRRKIRFMAKSQMFFRNRVLDYIYRVGGVFPVRRGHHDEEAFITAHSILDRGGCVLMYAEGGRSRSQQLGEPKAGVGPARARVGRAGRPGRDPWLEVGALVEAARLPEGDDPVRRADQLRRGRRSRVASSSSRRRARSSTMCGRCTRRSTSRAARA